MKKYFYPLFCLCVAMATTGCTDTDDPLAEPLPPEEETPDEPVDDAVDLSADEMANCYIVQSAGTYKFKADNQFNLGAGLPAPPEIHPVAAELVWQTTKGSITSVELDSTGDVPYVRFEVAEPIGNALIAVLNDDSEIVWSWHIWMPEVEITGIPTETGYEVMNLNLGATNNTPGDAASYGMLYQWGRKDPFAASATLTGDVNTVSAPLYDIDNMPVTISNSSWTDNQNNNIKYAISHPTVCLSNYPHYATSRDWLAQGNDALWGNPNGYDPEGGENKFAEKGRKTCYDPSPAGWRVAPADVFSTFTSTGGYAWDFADFNIYDYNNDGQTDLDDYVYGWHFNVNDKTALYFPAAARFDGSYAMLMGSMSGLWGNYWSNAPHPSVPGGAYCCLSFQVKSQTGQDWITVSPSGGASRADAYSVRCIRDK